MKKSFILASTLLLLCLSDLGYAASSDESVESSSTKASESYMSTETSDSESSTEQSTEATETTTTDSSEATTSSTTSEKETEDSTGSVEKNDRVFLDGEWIDIPSESDDISKLSGSPEITEDNQHVMGESHVKMQGRSYAANSYIPSNSIGIPNINFVDIASYQGTISVADFQNMKRQGVTGVVVKLTESLNYINPYAQSQINNAKAAGLKVSAYHYSWFTNKDLALKEAKFFANTAKSMGLDSNTVMVNDVEQAQINNGRVTENSLYFAAALKNEYGFNKVVHYSMASWFTPSIINMDKLGGNKSAWKAQFPDNPSNTNLLHTDTSAWQWASDVKFVGDSNNSRLFDVNTDYTGTFSTPLNIKKINMKTFINNDYGAIYDSPYYGGSFRQDLTTGMKNQLINITASCETSYGVWYQFEYKKNGVTKIGWIKSTDLTDIINQVDYDKTAYIKIENGVVYDSPYTNTTKKIDSTDNFTGKQFIVTKKAETVYGLWYYGTYQKNGESRQGWIKSTDLMNEYVTKEAYDKTAFIMNNGGAIYDSPYTPETKRIDLTTGMYKKAISLTSKATTSYGEWYQFSYEKGGSKKIGWIKSTDIAETIGQKNISKTMYLNKKEGVVYDSPYNNATKKIDSIDNFVDNKFNITKQAETTYGVWYYGSYTKNNETRQGWIKSVDLISENVQKEAYNNRVFIMNNGGAIYDSPYTVETTRLDITSGMYKDTINLTSKAKTSYGTWYQFAYQKGGVNKVGWIKSTDIKEVIDESSTNKTFKLAIEYGAVYDSPYVSSTKRIGRTNDFKNKEFKATKSARTAYGLWYYGTYTQNGEKKSGWIKSTDFK